MKKLIIISIAFFHSYFSLNAQWNIYLSAGISPESHPKTANLIVNRSTPLDVFLFNMPHRETQYFTGLNFRHELNDHFFTTIGTAYTQRKFQYTMSYITPRAEGTYQELMFAEHQINVPVNVGVRFEVIEITCGLKANMVVARTCELVNIPGFEDNEQFIQPGWQCGIQLHFGRVIAGVEYQSDFARLCSGMCVNGKSIELMQVPGQVVFAAQFQL